VNRNIEVAYGKGKIKVRFPPGVPFEVLETTSPEALDNPPEKVLEALRSPVAAPPLKRIVRVGETVCILVNDSTRLARSDIFMPVLIEELGEAGVAKKDIFIVFATGTHRPLSEPEMRELVGEKTASRVRMYNHDCQNEDNLVFLGHSSFNTPVWVNKKVARANRRILTGSVVHHYFAGFGGGRKALVPGVAGWETIRNNHSLLFDDRATGGRLEGNPVHMDLLEGALMAGGGFLLNTVLNEKKEILGVFAGDMVQAHLQACAMADKAYGVEITEPADVVIAGCGGYPKDINLYQAHKALDNAIKTMKAGGSLVLLAQCPDGIGSSLYEDWVDKYPDRAELERALRHNFVLGGHKAYTVGKLLQKGRVYLVSDLAPGKARRFGFIPVANLEKTLAELYQDRKDLRTYVLPQASLTVPRKPAGNCS